jgi:hypothetical protein
MGRRVEVALIFCLAGCAVPAEPPPVARVPRTRAQSLAAKARAGFSENKPSLGEEQFGVFLDQCRFAPEPDCAAAQAEVERAREEMWRRWQRLAERNPDRFSSDGKALFDLKFGAFRRTDLSFDEMRCQSELFNESLAGERRTFCQSLLAERERGRNERSASRNERELAKLDAELAALAGDAAVARRCDDSDAVMIRRYDPRRPVTELFRSVSGRCERARHAVERACEGRIRPLLDGGDTAAALVIARDERCSNAVYLNIVAGLLARPEPRDQPLACRDFASFKKVDMSRLDDRTRQAADRRIHVLDVTCDPVNAARRQEAIRQASKQARTEPADSPYPRTPAMLAPGASPSVPSAAPTRRGDCGSFSASGQRGTIYQSGCR